MLDYELLSVNDISLKHSNLLKSSENLEKCKLLNRAQRGRLYGRLKFSEKWHGQFSYLCNTLDICETSANRHIDFFLLVKSYPGLLITGLSFETIMNVYSELRQYLVKNDEISAMLKAPLRTTKVIAAMTIAAENIPQAGEPSEEYLSHGADWNGGWEVSDYIMSKAAAVVELGYDVEKMTVSDEDEGMLYSIAAGNVTVVKLILQAYCCRH